MRGIRDSTEVSLVNWKNVSTTNRNKSINRTTNNHSPKNRKRKLFKCHPNTTNLCNNRLPKNNRQVKDIIDKSKIVFSKNKDYVIILNREINLINFDEKRDSLINLLKTLEGEKNEEKNI